jgi:hypothetical protein
VTGFLRNLPVVWGESLMVLNYLTQPDALPVGNSAAEKTGLLNWLALDKFEKAAGLLRQAGIFAKDSNAHSISSCDPGAGH